MEEGEIGEERKSRRSRHENYDESSNPGPGPGMGQAYPPPVSGHPSGMNDYFNYTFIEVYVQYYFKMKHALDESAYQFSL